MSRITLTIILLLAASPSASPGEAAEAGAEADPGAEPEATRLRLFFPAWAQAGASRNPHELPSGMGFVFGQLPPEAFEDVDPEARFLRQTAGPYVSASDGDRLPDSIFARDDEGERVGSGDRPRWLVIPDHPDWLEELARWTERVMSSRFDGLLVDELAVEPLGGGAIDPGTGEAYEPERWLAAGSAMLGAVRGAMPAGKLLTINGVGRGERYWADPVERSPRALLEHADGVMSESVWREARAPLEAWPTVEQWWADVEMIRDAEERGLVGFWATICRPAESGDGAADEGAERRSLAARWRRFALASHLLAAGPRSHFFFGDDRGGAEGGGSAHRFPEYEAPLGEAVGPMKPIGDSGAYARQFRGGLVLVNPTDKPLAVARWPWNENSGPDDAYRSWGEDRTVRLPLSVPTHTGLILTPAEAQE